MTKKQQHFLDTLNKSLGILTLALQQSNTRYEEYESWLEEMDFELEVKKINETAVDFVENQLMKLVREGDLSAIQFYLKTKGKNRGY